MRRQSGDSASGSRPAAPPAGGPGRSRTARESHLARFGGALARAVHAFHTYPPGSPARADVIEVVRDALRPCIWEEADAVHIDVTSEGLSIGGEPVPGDRGPERALALALRKAYVSTVEIRAGASTRDFRQFCALMAFPDQIVDRIEELPEILAQRGVTHIVAHVISMHQTIEGGTVPSALLDLVQRKRERREQPADAAEGGWIRLDPSVPLSRVGLDDLPLLLRDAPSLAVALDKMSRSYGSVSPTEALRLHYEEITDLYASCDPAVSETLFRRLAQVVHELPDEVKLELLKEEVLPGLVDGRRSGHILQHFSEEAIADSLWLLLDLGVGGVEMLTVGLAKLDLPDARLEDVVARVSRRLEEDGTPDSALPDVVPTRSLSGGAGGLKGRLTMDEDQEADFVALRSFDLSVDAPATEELAVVVRRVAEADSVSASLRCYADILALSSDPAIVSATMRRARGLFFNLESRGQVASLADWLACFASVARGRDDYDGEVAEVVRGTLDQYVTPEFILRVSALPPDPDREPPLVTIICALGRMGVGALVESLAVESELSARNRLLTALQPHADELAEHLVEYLSHPQWFVVRNLLTLLGHAGPGREDAVAAAIEHEHPRVIREAFIALARMGTGEAADRTAAALFHDSPTVREHAAEAIWRFEPGLSHERLLTALDDPRLPRAYPALVSRLLVDAERRTLPDLEPVLRRLRWHGLALWNSERRALGWLALRQLRAAT